MNSGSSDFAERLKAMRAGKEVQNSPQTPSLKDRLNRGQTANNSSQDDLRESIKAKFKAQADARKVQAKPALQQETNPFKAANTPSENLPELQLAKLPEQKSEKKDQTQQWTPEDGGICPSCGTYNMAHLAFCGDCSYLLLRTETEIEIITSYPLSEMRGVVHTFINKLAALKVTSTETLLRAGLTHQNRQTLIKHSGMSERSLLRLIHQADLCRVPSMGPENTAMLELIGIHTLAELLASQPLEIYKKIQQSKIKLNQSGILFLPTKAQIQLWLEEASLLSQVKIS